MFRNQYDNDATTFSPQGRLHQVEYALEAIKQGSCAVGLRSDTHAALVTLKRNAEDLGSYQKKIIRIDNHLGIALAGLAPDARVLSNYMRQQAMSSKMIYNRPLPIQRISDSLADKAQRNTQHYGKRPYGVGLLIAGYDEQGPHLFEFVSSGTVLAYRATAIGARSQSARTYLERNVDALASSSKEELILHGLRALRDSLAQDKELTTANTSIALVGEDQVFTVMEGEELVPWLEKLGDVSMTAVRQREAAIRNAPASTAAGAGEAEMTETTPVAGADSTQGAAAEGQGEAMEE
ncbi:20S proteasome component alpha 6 subunit Pre5 [Protomyces lactucae-debilis]|uniref:Proteasome subunit alpha type n=1 Tax=Protomyces lactucae-debilis TaxID=2754530 RepID=A0A1Y2FN61_PROLT|nr:20S proteasome component alpha 6 subunit Pre5 [Protomyces lactucae-debilis]ORY85440.1 20S proteasome component alpha 6 subunit Pre5 [Protomyces lactucae-debilis]